MTKEQLDLSLNLQERFPIRAAQIEIMLSFVASTNNLNVWSQFTEQLVEALETNDEKKFYLLEGLMQRMRDMVEEKKPRKQKKSKAIWLWTFFILLALAIWYLLN